MMAEGNSRVSAMLNAWKEAGTVRAKGLRTPGGMPSGKNGTEHLSNVEYIEHTKSFILFYF